MKYRLPVIAAIAVFGLAACQGGGGAGGSNPMPAEEPGTTQELNAAAPLSNETFAVPQDAVAGVRTIVNLPLRNGDELDKLIANQSSEDSPLYHHWLTPEQFREAYGPSIQDLRSAASALQAYGFRTTITSQGVLADAPQATVERTFGIHLSQNTQRLGEEVTTAFVGDRAPVLPAALAKINANVIAFSPKVLRHFDHVRIDSTNLPENRFSPVGPYFFDDLKQAYEWPSFLVAHGQGKTIAIVAVSKFLSSDIAKYFGHEHLAVPRIIERPVSGGSPPFNPNSSASAEITLDIDMAGGAAPGATLIIYEIAKLDDPSLLGSFIAIAEDNKADLASVSIGGCELGFTPPYNGGISQIPILLAYHNIFRQLNSQGITFINSSGDLGALECTDPSGSRAIFGVSSWADDPNVTGVGGTNLVTSFVKGSLKSTYVSEAEFFDRFKAAPGIPTGSIFGSGGGKSVLFPKPEFQNFVNTHATTRAVPDVSLHMGGCPVGSVLQCRAGESADVIFLGGQAVGLIGTSASAPEFAGLQAIQDEVRGGRAGNLNSLLYFLAAHNTIGNGPIFHNDIPGNNGYPSGRGYNFVVGNGTLFGSQYVGHAFGPFAGNPQTPSNP